MEPWCVHRIANVKTKVDVVDDGLQDRCDDATATRASDNHVEFAVFQKDGGSHGRQRALSWPNGIRLALYESEHVRRAWLCGEVIHFVVHQEPRSGYRH